MDRLAALRAQSAQNARRLQPLTRSMTHRPPARGKAAGGFIGRTQTADAPSTPAWGVGRPVQPLSAPSSSSSRGGGSGLLGMAAAPLRAITRGASGAAATNQPSETRSQRETRNQREALEQQSAQNAIRFRPVRSGQPASELEPTASQQRREREEYSPDFPTVLPADDPEFQAAQRQRRSNRAAQFNERTREQAERAEAVGGGGFLDNLLRHQTSGSGGGVAPLREREAKGLDQVVRRQRGGQPETSRAPELAGQRAAGGFTTGNSAYRQEMIQRNARQLTQEEYDALTPTQQSAVQFNTGLLSAHAQGGDAVREYLNNLGIAPRGEEELNQFLNLDRAINENILERLGDSQATAQAAEARRAARGAPGGAPEAERLSAAQADAHRAGDFLSARLASTGHGHMAQAEEAPLAGFGQTPRDEAIYIAYRNMVDGTYQLTPQDVVDGISLLNHEMGTDVTPEEVWRFAGAVLDSVETDRSGTRRVIEEEVNPITGQPIQPLDVAEIRARYGL